MTLAPLLLFATTIRRLEKVAEKQNRDPSDLADEVIMIHLNAGEASTNPVPDTPLTMEEKLRSFDELMEATETLRPGRSQQEIDKEIRDLRRDR